MSDTLKDEETADIGLSSNALFALVREWLDVADKEDDLAARSTYDRNGYNPNGALARARGRTLRNCAKELSELILANAELRDRSGSGTPTTPKPTE